MPLKTKIKHEQPNPPMANVDPGVQIPKEDEGNWLVSYADMMTLLCGFFIMLFTMAKMDPPKYDSFKQAMAEQFGGQYVSPTKELKDFVTQIIKEAGLEAGVVVKSDALGVSVVFESTVFFDTLSSEVTETGKKTLKTLIEAIGKHQLSKSKAYRIVVEGHTDSRPIIGGLYPSNWELSGARAARVVRMFLDLGFAPDRLTAIGYADTRPQYPARTQDGKWDEAALAKNRRVVLRILEPRVDSIPFPDSPAQVAAQTKQETPRSPAATSPGTPSAASPTSASATTPAATTAAIPDKGSVAPATSAALTAAQNPPPAQAHSPVTAPAKTSEVPSTGSTQANPPVPAAPIKVAPISQKIPANTAH